MTKVGLMAYQPTRPTLLANNGQCRLPRDEGLLRAMRLGTVAQIDSLARHR